MSEEYNPLKSIFDLIMAHPRPDGRGNIIALTSAFKHSGTSYVSRHLALLAAESYASSGRRAALIDFDINQQTQAAAFDTPKMIAAYGTLEGPYDATFNQKPFWQISPGMLSGNGERLSGAANCGFYLLSQTALAVSKFDWQTIKAGQSVHVVKSPEYWDAMRTAFGIVFVDCPASEASDFAMSVVSDADVTVIISPEHRSGDSANAQLVQSIEFAGGTCLGMVLNAGLSVRGYAGNAS